MNTTENLFAKSHLTDSVRFIAALKITAKKFCNGNFNASAILFGIMGDFDSANRYLSGYQRNALADIAFGSDKCDKIREFFVDIYNDDETLINFLDNKITERSISLNRNKNKRNREENLDISKEIINSNLLANLSF